MIGFAVVFGLLAVFIAQVWLNNQASMQAKNYEANKKPMATKTIVVAKESLRFGTELTAAMLQEVPWPAEAMPTGAFAKIDDIVSGGRRVVLSAIEANEPVLALKITGAGQRATLSALVKPGMKAVTIRVNDVEGVGGFVLPGDHVDVVLTRQIEKGSATTEVVLQNTRVLAIDQIRRRARVQGGGRQIGDAGSGHGRSSESLAGVFGRQPVAAAAQGRRNRRSEDAQDHAQGFGEQRSGRRRQGRDRDGRGHAGFVEAGIHRAGRGA